MKVTGQLDTWLLYFLGEVLPVPIAEEAGWALEQTWTLWGLYPFQECSHDSCFIQCVA